MPRICMTNFRLSLVPFPGLRARLIVDERAKAWERGYHRYILRQQRRIIFKCAHNSIYQHKSMSLCM